MLLESTVRIFYLNVMNIFKKCSFFLFLSKTRLKLVKKRKGKKQAKAAKYIDK